MHWALKKYLLMVYIFQGTPTVVIYFLLGTYLYKLIQTSITGSYLSLQYKTNVLPTKTKYSLTCKQSSSPIGLPRYDSHVINEWRNIFILKLRARLILISVSILKFVNILTTRSSINKLYYNKFYFVIIVIRLYYLRANIIIPGKGGGFS